MLWTPSEVRGSQPAKGLASFTALLGKPRRAVTQPQEMAWMLLGRRLTFYSILRYTQIVRG